MTEEVDTEKKEVYIEKLTAEQEAMLPEFVIKWTDIGRSTEPADREAAEKHLLAAYAKVGQEAPEKMFWADSPQAGHDLHCWLSEKKEWVDPFYGQHEAGWLAFYDVFREFGVDVSKIDPLTELAKCCGWVWMFEKAAILTDRPSKISVDEDDRLHSLEGMAIEYRDGFGLYCVHGIRVKEKIVMAPETITVEEVDAEENSEVRRVMMTQMGEGKYLLESGAQCVSEDKYGKLYKKVVADDEDLCMIRVINSTPEPDGTSNIYWLRVPENITTPHEGVAWGFGKTTETYNPLHQT